MSVIDDSNIVPASKEVVKKKKRTDVIGGNEDEN